MTLGDVHAEDNVPLDRNCCPLTSHLLLTQVIHGLEGLFRNAFNKNPDAWQVSQPAVNLFYYVPRFQSCFQVVPFKPEHRNISLAGSESPFFQDLTTQSPTHYLRDDELRVLTEHAMHRPHVKDALADVGARGAYEFLDVHNGTTRSLLYSILSRFNSDPVGFVNALESPERKSLFHGIVHAALSALPQFSTEDTFVGIDDDDYEFVPRGYKEKRLKSCMQDFAEGRRRGSELHWTRRLFLLLSVIESLQWNQETAFGVFNNPLKFSTSKTYKKYRVLAREWIPLHQLRLYFYGTYETDPLKDDDPESKARRAEVKAVLQNMLVTVGRIISELILDERRSFLGAFSEHIPDASTGVLDGLLHFLGPSRADIVSYSNNGDHQVVRHTKRGIKEYSELSEILHGASCEAISEQSLIVGASTYSHEVVRADRKKPIVTVFTRELLPDPCYLELHFADEYNREQYLYARKYRECLVVLLRRLALTEHFYQRKVLSGNGPECPLHSSYSRFDGGKQAAVPHVDQTDEEAEFLIHLLECYRNVETAVICDSGNGNDVVVDTLAKTHSSCNPVTVDRSDPTVTLAHYTNTARVVLLRFNVCGYSTQDPDNVSFLRGAYDMVRPGGTLVIEQLNPQKLRHDRLEITMPNIIGSKGIAGGERDGCVTYSSYVRGEQYTRQRSFRFHTSGPQDADSSVAKHDYYEMRLYDREWFTSHLLDTFGAATCDAFGDFAGTSYDGTDKPEQLIVVSRKPYDKADLTRGKIWIGRLKDRVEARKMRVNTSIIKAEGRILDFVLDQDYPTIHDDLLQARDDKLRGLVAKIVQSGTSS